MAAKSPICGDLESNMASWSPIWRPGVQHDGMQYEMATLPGVQNDDTQTNTATRSPTWRRAVQHGNLGAGTGIQ